jgi:excinuclease ABC subunit B
LRKKISDINDSIIKEDADTEQVLEEAMSIKKLRKDKQQGQSPAQDLANLITELTAQMKLAASELNFELAARYRDEIHELKKELRQMVAAGHA